MRSKDSFLAGLIGKLALAVKRSEPVTVLNPLSATGLANLRLDTMALITAIDDEFIDRNYWSQTYEYTHKRRGTGD